MNFLSREMTPQLEGHNFHRAVVRAKECKLSVPNFQIEFSSSSGLTIAFSLREMELTPIRSGNAFGYCAGK